MHVSIICVTRENFKCSSILLHNDIMDNIASSIPFLTCLLIFTSDKSINAGEILIRNKIYQLTYTKLCKYS